MLELAYEIWVNRRILIALKMENQVENQVGKIEDKFKLGLHKGKAETYAR